VCISGCFPALIARQRSGRNFRDIEELLSQGVPDLLFPKSNLFGGMTAATNAGVFTTSVPVSLQGEGKVHDERRR
jgi:hypothetical protein